MSSNGGATFSQRNLRSKTAAAGRSPSSSAQHAFNSILCLAHGANSTCCSSSPDPMSFVSISSPGTNDQNCGLPSWEWRSHNLFGFATGSDFSEPSIPISAVTPQDFIERRHQAKLLWCQRFTWSGSPDANTIDKWKCLKIRL